MNKLFDEIYCINLRTSENRRKAMIDEFARHNISNASFIEAIKPEFEECQKVLNNGNSSSYQKVKKRCYCIEKCSHRPRKLRPVEVAISLSHLKVYRDIIKKNSDLALICEDDIVFHKEAESILRKLLTPEIINNLLSKTPYIIFLGGRSDNPNLSRNDQTMSVAKTGSYSNYCYIINYACAEILIKHFFPIERPEDSYKRHLINQGKIKCYQVIPSLVGELSTGINHKSVYSRLSK